MLVFHDWSRKWRLRSFARECLWKLSSPLLSEIDHWRQVLIRVGQLEQGYFDLLPQEEVFKKNERATAIRGLTDKVANGFHACFKFGADYSTKLKLSENLSQITRSLEQIQQFENRCLTIKTPEGFAFYSLFPEQYCSSAERWATDQAAGSNKKVLVVGIRSIGTTLSAVVAATLNALGWKAERITVRPTGPPFSRTMPVRPFAGNGRRCALVVDEGPGLSGSSMIAVAQWLSEAGISQIALLPGHNSGPGPKASSELRQLWSKLPLFFTPLEEVRWQGRSFGETLQRESGIPGELHDLSSGVWRNWAYNKRTEWPAVCVNLERRKLLSVGR